MGDWASHDIEHEISGIYDVAHGAGLAVVFPAWMKYVYRENRDKFVQFAVRVWNVDMDFEDPERTTGRNRSTKRFYKNVGLPTSLKDLGISDDRLEEMADKCTAGDTKTVGNFKRLGKQDVLNILKMAL